MFKINDNKIGNNDNFDIGDNKNNKSKKSEKTTNKNNSIINTSHNTTTFNYCSDHEKCKIDELLKRNEELEKQLYEFKKMSFQSLDGRLKHKEDAEKERRDIIINLEKFSSFLKCDIEEDYDFRNNLLYKIVVTLNRNAKDFSNCLNKFDEIQKEKLIEWEN